MYAYQIVAMADRVIDAGLARYQDKQEIIEAIGSYWENRIAHTWTIHDVQGVDESLSDEDAREILDTLLCKFDAEIGINWEVIRARIFEYKESKND